MTTAERYRQKQLEVTLSSGDKIRVRPLNKTDFLFLGDIPNVIGSGEADQVLRRRNPGDTRRLIEGNLAFFERLVTCALTRCVTTPGFKVVDKPVVECGPDELALDEVSQPDQTAIATVVLKASGLIGREVACEAKTFPQEQTTPSLPGHDGSALRDPSPPTS